MTVFVFKTNVKDASVAAVICRDIGASEGVWRVNFDLHDDDKILRVEAGTPVAELVCDMVRNRGFVCDELE
jgi:hypothetical protein